MRLPGKASQARFEVHQFGRIETCSPNAHCPARHREQTDDAEIDATTVFFSLNYKPTTKHRKIQSQHRSQLKEIIFTCLTILLLSLPYIRKREPQFFTCGCSSCRIFCEANCFPTLLFLPVKITMKTCHTGTLHS